MNHRHHSKDQYTVPAETVDYIRYLSRKITPYLSYSFSVAHYHLAKKSGTSTLALEPHFTRATSTLATSTTTPRLSETTASWPSTSSINSYTVRSSTGTTQETIGKRPISRSTADSRWTIYNMGNSRLFWLARCSRTNTKDTTLS